MRLPTSGHHFRPIRVWLAWWCAYFFDGAAEPGVDYTSRCPGCGYYAGEEKAGEDHYGWSCGSAACAWWEPLSGWWWGTGLIWAVRKRWGLWRFNREAKKSNRSKT